MEELIQLLQLMTTQDKIKVHIDYLDSTGAVTGSETQVTDIAQQLESPLKSVIGQAQYNKLRYEISKAQRALGFDGLKINLQLQLPIGELINQINPPLVQPIASITTYYDLNLDQQMIAIDITNWHDYVYEIEYMYDQGKAETIYTTLDHYELQVIPNKTIHVKIRARKLNSVTEWSEYEITTQRDITPPSQPIVDEVIPRYRGTTIKLQQPQESDFSYFYITFVLDSRAYTIRSNTNIIDIDINKVYNVEQTIYQVDTSNNTSAGTTVTINSLQFTEAEQTIQNQIQNNTNIINQLTDQTTISIQITNITDNQVTVSDQTGIKSGYYLKLDKLYKITDVSGSTLILDRQPIGTYTTGIVQQPIQSFGTQLNQQQDAITANSQKLSTQQLESQLANGQYYSNGQIVDPNQDFLTRGIDVGFVVELIGTNKRITTTVKTINQNILILNTTDPGPFNSYKVYSSQQFVQSKLAFDYDSITSTVESNNFNVVKAGTVTSINEIAGSVQVTGESFDQIKIGSVVKLSDQELTRYYTVTQVNGDTFYVEPKDYLQQYNESLSDKSYTIYDSKSIIQSQIAQTQNEISTSVLNTKSNLQSQIQQTSDQIDLRVLKIDQDNSNITQLSVQDGKIQIDQDKFQINADTLVNGTLRATDSLEIVGGTEGSDVRINNQGIVINSGNVNLGKKDTNGYKTQLNNDGSGKLADGQISWDTNGNVTFGSNVKIGFSNIGDDVKDSIDELTNTVDNISTQLNTPVIVLDQLTGQFMSWESDYTIIRQRVLQNGVEINQNDSNMTPYDNAFSYKWYITDLNNNKMEIQQYQNMPELTLYRNSVNIKQRIECEQMLK